MSNDVFDDVFYDVSDDVSMTCLTMNDFSKINLHMYKLIRFRRVNLNQRRQVKFLNKVNEEQSGFHKPVYLNFI